MSKKSQRIKSNSCTKEKVININSSQEDISERTDRHLDSLNRTKALSQE